jgi:hypothetical protein
VERRRTTVRFQLTAAGMHGTPAAAQGYCPACQFSVENLMRIRCLIIVALAFIGSRSVRAQLGEQGSRVPIANRSYVAFNPMGIPFDIFTAEVESGVAQGITLGGVASHVDIDNDRYTSLDFKFRYYPSEVVLRGFSLGASVGYLGYSTPGAQSNVFPGSADNSRVSMNAPTIGIIIDYNWLLGSQHRFLVGTGLGAKRVLASADQRRTVGLDRAYPTARFTVGLAF